MRLKHWDDAIEELQAAVALCPSQEDLLLSLATAHLGRWHQRHRREDVANVRLRVKECLSLKPDSEEALQLLAKLERACQWHRNLLVGLILGLGSFLTTSSLVLFGPKSLIDSWGSFWPRQSQLEQLEQQLWREIEVLRQEQEQLREEVWSSQRREKQLAREGLTQLNQRLKRLEQSSQLWRYPVLWEDHEEHNWV